MIFRLGPTWKIWTSAGNVRRSSFVINFQPSEGRELDRPVRQNLIVIGRVENWLARSELKILQMQMTPQKITAVERSDPH